MPKTIQAAKNYVASGLSVIPVKTDGSKAPATLRWKPYQRRIATPDELESLFENGCGVGVVAGSVSGNLTIIDFEAGAPVKKWAELVRDYGLGDLLEKLPLVETPGGGWHVYFRCSDGVNGNEKLAMAKGARVLIETRAEGGYAIAPGSPAACHKSGKPYRLVRGSLDAIPELTAEQRDFLLDAARSFNECWRPEPERPATNGGADSDRPGDEFNRRSSWPEVLEPAGWKLVFERDGAGFWRRPGKDHGISATTDYSGSGLLYVFSTNAAPFEHETSYSKFAAYSLLNHAGDFRAAARELGAQGYGEPPTRKRIAGSPAKAAGAFHLTDSGNAMRFISEHGRRVRWVPAWRAWAVWDGKRWRRDDLQKTERLAKKTVTGIYRAAAAESDGKRREKIAKWALSSESAARLSAMLRLAECEVATAAEEFDRDPDLLTVSNGTLDLSIGALREHRPDDLITRLIDHRYDSAARCPRFLSFLREVMADREELVRYLQTAFGYALTGRTASKSLFVLHGPGDNGKTTLLTVVSKIVGECAGSIQIESLTDRARNQANQPDIADLQGKRFVTTSETSTAQRLSEATLKRICQGMGKIRAARKYENPIEFEETHKLFLDCNHRPLIKDDGPAVWNRLHLIPFDVTVPKGAQDPDLVQKLLSESEGILAWMVEGAGRWYREGLQRPEAVSAATDKWREESDQVSAFIDERCTRGPNESAEIGALYAAYKEWCEKSGERYLSKRAFGQKMDARGFDMARTGKSRYRVGVGVSE